MRMRRRSPRYRDELKRNRHKNIVMWLVAPQIPTSVREFLDDKGIEYSEFHFGQFRRVAERHSFIIKSEAESSSQSGPSKVPENKNQSRQPRGLCSSQQGISLVPKGPLVTSGSALRWSARGRDLQLQNVDALDCAKFDSLLDAFSHAVRSKKNSSVVRNLRAWAASPRYSVLSSATIESLLRWALNESNWKANAQDAFEVWKFLFGSPAPTWKNWDELEKRYELDSNGWQQWYASL